MSEYFIASKMVYEVVEITEDGDHYLVADFETEEEAEQYKTECEDEG